MRGFTLIELLVSAVILSIIIAGVYMFSIMGEKTYITDVVLLDLQQQLRQAMSWMTREIREAKDIQNGTIDNDSDWIQFNTFNETNIRYYRDINDVNNDGVVNQVIREYPSGTRRILANDITRLKFYLIGNISRIELEASKVALQRTLSLSLTEQVKLRNE